MKMKIQFMKICVVQQNHRIFKDVVLRGKFKALNVYFRK